MQFMIYIYLLKLFCLITGAPRSPGNPGLPSFPLLPVAPWGPKNPLGPSDPCEFICENYQIATVVLTCWPLSPCGPGEPG